MATVNPITTAKDKKIGDKIDKNKKVSLYNKIFFSQID